MYVKSEELKNIFGYGIKFTLNFIVITFIFHKQWRALFIHIRQIIIKQTNYCLHIRQIIVQKRISTKYSDNYVCNTKKKQQIQQKNTGKTILI